MQSATFSVKSSIFFFGKKVMLSFAGHHESCGFECDGLVLDLTKGANPNVWSCKAKTFPAKSFLYYTVGKKANPFPRNGDQIMRVKACWKLPSSLFSYHLTSSTPTSWANGDKNNQVTEKVYIFLKRIPYPWNERLKCSWSKNISILVAKKHTQKLLQYHDDHSLQQLIRYTITNLNQYDLVK